MSEIIRIGGVEIRFLIDKDQSRGSLDMFEVAVQPGARVPAPHYHEAWEETVYGLEGEMSWRIGGADVVTRPGDHAFIARGVPHHFINKGLVPAKVLSVLTPGVLGPEYFRELAALLADGPPDPDKVGAIMRRHGLVPAPA